MAAIINRDDAPTHLFSIPELDFSGDLFSERAGRTLACRRSSLLVFG